jgi:heat shock protein HslJ
MRAAAVLAAAGGVVAGGALLGPLDGQGVAAAAPTTSVVGHVFRSVSVEQDGRPMPLFDGATTWVSIDRRSLGVYGGCNSIGGALRVTPSRLRVSQIGQTEIGCSPAELEHRDDALVSFFLGDPSWRLRADRLVLEDGRTTITLERDDLPPPLPRENPARRQDLVDASLGTGEYRTWPQGLGGAWRGPFVTVDVAVRDGRTFLTMRARCRRLEAPVAIHRTTLTVGAPRSRAARCRSSGSDESLTSVRPFFGGEVMWHLDRRRLTLQRHRSTLTLRVR